MLARCLNSIAPQLNESSEVIVVDNASEDNSRDLVKNMFPWAKLIANTRNLDFAVDTQVEIAYTRAPKKGLLFTSPISPHTT
jgi:glycosyltransferase involved in cell wall biosynthesis